MKWEIHIYDPKSETTTTHVKDYPGTSTSMADAPAVVAKASRDFRKHMKYILAVPHREAKRQHATKKSPAQLEREIAEALAKSGKGPRPSKLGGDYFTVVLSRAKPDATNEWNRLPAGWDSQTRGTFPTKYAAYKWAREKLLPGAPFTVRYVPLES
jgi:hypothetical protein